MREQKLTRKITIIFRFCHFKNMQREPKFRNAYMYLAMLGNQLLSSIFADYISILSKLRRNTADIQGIWMDYHDKILFL